MQFAFALQEPPSVLPEIRQRLLQVFGPQQDPVRHDPTSQLVKAMISSQTKDDVSQMAFRRLAGRYPHWEFLLVAPTEEIEATISEVTYADRKAVDLPRALRIIEARNGSLDLHFLADLGDDAAMRWLDVLPGVAAKTAAVVLNFSSLRKRTLPVDGHLLRVGRRLKLIPQNADSQVGYDAYTRLVPDVWDGDAIFEVHWLIKYHSQTTCTDKAPACGRCILRDLCPSRRTGPILLPQ